jgi:hypothetical protein
VTVGVRSACQSLQQKKCLARAGGLEVAARRRSSKNLASGSAGVERSLASGSAGGKVATRTKIATQRVVHGGTTYITLDLSGTIIAVAAVGGCDRGLDVRSDVDRHSIARRRAAWLNERHSPHRRRQVGSNGKTTCCV